MSTVKRKCEHPYERLRFWANAGAAVRWCEVCGSTLVEGRTWESPEWSEPQADLEENVERIANALQMLVADEQERVATAVELKVMNFILMCILPTLTEKPDAVGSVLQAGIESIRGEWEGRKA